MVLGEYLRKSAVTDVFRDAKLADIVQESGAWIPPANIYSYGTIDVVSASKSHPEGAQMSKGVEQEIASEGYVHPEALVTTQCVAKHLDDTGWTE
jgi:hypothetical protein